MFKGTTILITGGTGSWGYTLTRALLQAKPREIRIFSRGEFAQVQMQRAFADHPALKFIIGDIRDLQAVRAACTGVDYVFHLAALKHVPICEQQPDETLKTNVLGTQNIITASIEENVKKVIDVSTDKAVEPVNFYGMTKALGEKLMIHADQMSRNTRFVCVRGGNVLGSNGSVVPLFTSQIVDRGFVTLTSKAMTRFFLTLQEAIDLLLHAATIAVGGEILVMKMSACRITDLADVLSQHFATSPVEIVEIGIRPGEKIHEVLVSRHEASQTFKVDGRYYVILPQRPSAKLLSTYSNYPRFEHEVYESNQNLISQHDIRQMLDKGGFLP
ncbi:polysaccharide biosynthesis protein [Alicyclobacillus fastidiosus]|uniref:Polysaccharide biosynthesis protein n=1 Tax=Alicyclobacillus fastidiosus TaxID=392011 RepID=A0ABV5AHU8_9BACL|nr:polysaccharide biosynthesis protein [Alicyclobacillus fastidiosus]WEH08894.1 polysaccharide biosynthesis protein [Alicyclobacillus fastidiosus]